MKTIDILKNAPLYRIAEKESVSIHVDETNEKGRRFNKLNFPYFTPLPMIGKVRTRRGDSHKLEKAVHKLFNKLETEKVDTLRDAMEELYYNNNFKLFDFDRYISRILNAGLIEELLVPILNGFGVSADRLCMILHYACRYSKDTRIMYGLLDLVLLEDRRSLQPKDTLVSGIKKLPIEEIRIILKFMSLHWKSSFNSIHWIDCITTAIPKKLMEDTECLIHLSKISLYIKQSLVLTKKQLQMLGYHDTIANHKILPQKHSEFQYKIYAIPDKYDNYYKSQSDTFEKEDAMEIEEIHSHSRFSQ